MQHPIIELKGIQKIYQNEDKEEYLAHQNLIRLIWKKLIHVTSFADIRLESPTKNRTETGIKESEEISILNQLELQVRQGEFVAIQGESGSGKTTLLRILGLMDNKYQGDYFFEGRLLRSGQKNIVSWSLQEEIRATNIGFIFQEDRLLEHIKAETNIELPLLIHNWSKKERSDCLKAMMKTGKIFSKKEIDARILRKKRRQLSGGQRQRVAVSRAMTLSPALILADEPTANLDPSRKEKIVEILRNHCHNGHTVIVVSHDKVFEKADTVYELQNGRLVVKHKRENSIEQIEHTVVNSQIENSKEDANVSNDNLQNIQTVISHKKGKQADQTSVNIQGEDFEEKDGDFSSLVGSKPIAFFFQDGGKKNQSFQPKTLHKDKNIWGGLKPRTPFWLHINLALKDLLFRSRMFTFLIVGALAIGAFQATIFLSLHTGTNELLDELIRAGSRLTRITISTKDITAADRFPDSEQIKNISGVKEVIFRREGVYRVKDVRGRYRGEIFFGLHSNDPEIKLLKFTAGHSFTSEEALEVIMAERNIRRLFKVPGETITDEFRESLLGQQITFVITRPQIPGDSPQNYNDPEDMPREEVQFKCRLIGIVAQAESSRNFYFPIHFQLILEKWRLDESRKFTIPFNSAADGWTVKQNKIKDMLDFQWAERAHIYLKTINEVVPAHVRLTGMGYEPRSDILKNFWIIDARRLSRYFLAGLVGLAVIIGMINIANNISTSVQLRRKEIVLFKLLGMRVGDISIIYIWNAIIASLIGTLLGFVVGSLTVSGLSNFLEDRYKDAIFAQLFAPTWQFLWMIVILGGIIALIASLLPAYRAGKLNLVEGFES